jgi:EAL domain-containing protein (putative c-di-GMP-specific phosphodiesterase class I)
VRVEDSKVVGMEALLRWHNDTYGELAPGQFIQWLEKDECFFELGNWILRQALTDGLEIVKDQPDFVVNVNVSYTQFEQNDFRDSLMEILQETGFPPENLYIELTERCEVTDLLSLCDILDFFRSSGIKIALDDFGTGSASLNLLRKLPINCLKIDRTFISNIRTSQTDEVIVEMIIDSANRLGMSVCLEGVENAEIRDYVKKFKVTNHQGYYYSRPVQIEKFKELLTA